MPSVGVLCALPQELAFLLDSLEAPSSGLAAGMRFHTGRLDGRDVVLAHAGMGKVNAAVAATLLIERFGAGTVVFSGVAGGLDPDLGIGDVVLADEVVQHDAGYEAESGFVTYQAGHLPFFSPTDRLGYRADADLLDRARGVLADLTLAPIAAAGGRSPHIVFGRVLTGDQFVNSEIVRARLHRTLGGRAVEMEGAAMAQACEAFGVPWLVIRALSDLAGHESHFDFALFVEEVALSSALILRRLLPVL